MTSEPKDKDERPIRRVSLTVLKLIRIPGDPDEQVDDHPERRPNDPSDCYQEN